MIEWRRKARKDVRLERAHDVAVRRGRRQHDDPDARLCVPQLGGHRQILGDGRERVGEQNINGATANTAHGFDVAFAALHVVLAEAGIAPKCLFQCRVGPHDQQSAHELWPPGRSHISESLPLGIWPRARRCADRRSSVGLEIAQPSLK